MVTMNLPANPMDAVKPVEPEHLVPRSPRTAWDGWFAIAIFPAGSKTLWMKAHFYDCGFRKGHTPFSAVEGFGDQSEVMIAWAGSERITVVRRELERRQPEASVSPLRVERDGRFRLEGEAPRYAMVFSIPEDRSEATFRFEVGWPVWWSRWGRMLTYAGQHGRVRVDGVHGDARTEMEGFGVMEHVCGMSLPFDFTRATSFHYHWDVLAFHRPESPFDSAAGLSIGRGGKTLLGLRSFARLSGGSAQAMQGLSVRYLEVSRGKNAAGREIMSPRRWEGTMRSPAGSFRYEARATTPLAAILPGGGMLGFAFEGEWKSSKAASESWGGTGFCEYGDFSGTLARLARSSG